MCAFGGVELCVKVENGTGDSDVVWTLWTTGTHLEIPFRNVVVVWTLQSCLHSIYSSILASCLVNVRNRSAVMCGVFSLSVSDILIYLF